MVKYYIILFLYVIQLCFGIANVIILKRNTDMKNADMHPWECLLCITIIQFIFLMDLPFIDNNEKGVVSMFSEKKTETVIETLFISSSIGISIWCLVTYFNGADIDKTNEFGKMFLANVIWSILFIIVLTMYYAQKRINLDTCRSNSERSNTERNNSERNNTERSNTEQSNSERSNTEQNYYEHI